MAKFIKGDIVAVSFPFSDLTQAMRRPALSERCPEIFLRKIQD
jgi:hypothetical protein